MPTPDMCPGQKTIEERFGKIKNQPVDLEKTPAQQFGKMEDWMFTLGEDTLFLNPFTKRWYFFDRAHNDWKDIDVPAGTGVFSLVGGELVVGKLGSQDVPAMPSGRSGQRFCQQCGTILKPGLKFCSSCGTKIP